MGAAGTPTGAPKAPKGDAGGATSPEGEGNPAERGNFASLYQNTPYFESAKFSFIYENLFLYEKSKIIVFFSIFFSKYIRSSVIL